MIKGQKVGNIAVIGERELVLGFRLVGVENSFIAEKEKGVEALQGMMRDKKFSLIMVSESLKSYMDQRTLRAIDVSTDPVVVFIPLPGGQDLESVNDLAKRILGVEIGR
ncbi:MAG: V-type ATP synthase subunit F [Candidatus Thermoplasmatota archaeon]|nr:V-type ATP synthase subunit F [Candidatus Thermoplasmatota archaeon]